MSVSTAENCYGYSDSNTGLYANIASNSYGESGFANGLFVNDIAIGCRGKSGGSGIGLSAYLANSCRGTKADGVTISQSITNKYNMP